VTTLAKVQRSGNRALATVSSGLKRMPRRLKRGGAALGTARGRAARLIRKNPIAALVGASALGFVVAKVKRFV
jgi:hypothetical protein